MSSGERPSRSALLICNGEPPKRPLLKRLARHANLVVAADGGANQARRLGVTPDVIIGDLDSITPATERHFKRVPTVRVPRQDNTDLEKALDYLTSQGVSEVTIVGCTGRRMDFTLANLSVLWRYSRSLSWCVAGDDWYALPVGAHRNVEATRGTTVSLVPFGACRGITLRGLHYPMVDGTLRIGQVAVSNVVRSSPFSVKMKSGKLLLIILEPLRMNFVRR
jgi:thiamine pyrophosphokinase